MRQLFLLIAALFYLCASGQVEPIINNGFLSEQGWSAAIHPSGNYIIRSDRSTIHAYSRQNNLLFQTYSTPCITRKIYFDESGNYMIVQTDGEIGYACRHVLIYDFYTGKILKEFNGKVAVSLADKSKLYLVTWVGKNDEFMELPDPEFQMQEVDLTNESLDANVYYNPFDEKLKNPQDIGLEEQYYILGDLIIYKSPNYEVQVFNRKTEEFQSIAVNANFFNYQYLKASNELCFFDLHRDSLMMINLESFKVTKKSLHGFTADYFFIHDGKINQFDIRAHSVYVFDLNTDQQLETKTFKTRIADNDLFENGSYYGIVDPENQMIFHLNEYLFDCNKINIGEYKTYVGNDYVHPAIARYYINDPTRIGINEFQWQRHSAVQFVPFESPCKPFVFSNPDDAMNLKNVFIKFHYDVLNCLPLYNYSEISYTKGYLFGSSCDSCTGNVLLNQAILTPDKITNSIFIDSNYFYVESEPFAYYRFNRSYFNNHKVDYRKAVNWINRYYSAESIRLLNMDLPSFVFMNVTKDYERQQYAMPVSYLSKDKDYLRTVIDEEPSIKYTNKREEAINSYLRNQFKISYNGSNYSDESFTVSLLNRGTIPDITYAGIIPENDLFFQDIRFPINNGERLVFNYAHGYFILEDEKGTVITKSSLYRNGDFIHVTPDGYYFASKSKLNRISIRHDKNVYAPEQFDLKYNRPDIVLQRLGCTDTLLLNAYKEAWKKRLKKMNFTEEMLKDDYHLPEIEIQHFEQLPSVTDSSFMELNLYLKDDLYQLDRVNIYINAVPVFGSNGISVREKNANQLILPVKFNLLSGENHIEISVLNSAGAESYRESFTVLHKLQGTTSMLPDLYVVTVGVGNYLDERYNLKYAEKDARDLTSAMKLQQNRIYRKVHTLTLCNDSVKLENMELIRDFLKGAGIDDVVMISWSGHGVLDAEMDYYLATYDMDFNHPEKRGIAYTDLENILDGIAPLKKIVLLDACHSGEIDKEEVELVAQEMRSSGEINFRNSGTGLKSKTIGLQSINGLMQEMFADFRKGTGATIISSSSGVELSMESNDWKNGLFTYCFLQGCVNGKADLNGDGKVMLSELQEYIRKEVMRLSNGAQTPTSRIENAEMDVWLY